jgi:hypothetical protein
MPAWNIAEFAISFSVLWFLVGAAAAAYPVRVARLPGRKGDLPPRSLSAWRLIGVIVAVDALAKLFSVLAGKCALWRYSISNPLEPSPTRALY